MVVLCLTLSFFLSQIFAYFLVKCFFVDTAYFRELRFFGRELNIKNKIIVELTT